MTLKKLLTIFLMMAFIFGPGWAEEEATKAAEGQKSVKTMLDYRAELGMTDSQVKDLTETLKSFQQTISEHRSGLQAQEKEFRKLLSENAPLSDIKAKLRQISDTRFHLRYADVLTSRRVAEILKPEQMKKWREIQAKVRAQK